MKKILISGYYGFDNFGDEMILQILLEHLRGQDVTVLSANPDKTSRLYNVKSLNSFDVQNLMPKLQEFDVLISGGGSLLQNVTSNRSLFYYGGLIQMMNAMKKDVIIFAQGIGPINGFLGAWFTKNALKKSKIISVRDETSQNLLKSWGINANLVVDPVFGLKLPAIAGRSRKVGIQLRRFDNLTDELFDEIVKQVARKFSDRKIELISFQDAEDVGISEVFYNKYKQKYPASDISIVKSLTNRQIINKISEYSHLIAMRYHANLLGIKYGIKTMAICYDPKVEILAKETQIPYLVMDSSKNDYKMQFDRLDSLVSFNLLKYASTKDFDWKLTGIDDIIK